MFIIPATNPIAFNLFNIPIYKYGVVMASAIFVAMLVANIVFNKWLITKDKISKKDCIVEYAPFIIILGLLGARLYFCLLNPNFYLSHPIEILDIRQGGLSIHGAILGGVLSVLLIMKRTGISFLTLMDSLSSGVFLGQAIGRWGNYFNSEAFGLPVVGQKWGLYIPEVARPVEYIDYSLFHPTFLYESVLDLCGFVFILFVAKKYGAKFKGITFFTYLIIYSLIRFLIEQIRIDSALNFGSVPVAIIASGLFFTVGVIGIILVLKNVKTF